MDTFIDLFAGIGGFRIVLEKLGLKCVFSSEIDKNAKRVYSENFNSEVHGDITKIDAKDIPEHDILCAGFPCQSFSINGKRMALEDRRGMLFYEIVRIAKYHKPDFLFLENVKNILYIDDGDVIRCIIDELNEIGYNVHYSLLNSSHFGVPQSRERVYFVCTRHDSGLKYKEPLATYEQVFLEDVLDDDKEVSESFYVEHDDMQFTESLRQTYRLKPIRIGQILMNKREKSDNAQGYRIYHEKGHAVTLMANGCGLGRCTGLYYINDKVRRLTIKETKKLMGFPDWYNLQERDMSFKQLGNSVVTNMIGKVYEGVI